MEFISSKWVLAFSVSVLLSISTSFSVEGLGGDSKIRGVNLGGWLVIEGWIKPSLFEGIPNGDMLDGTQIQLKSTALQKFVSAENGGGSDVSINRDSASSWETFTLWRVSESEFNFRTTQGKFLTCGGEGNNVSAAADSPYANETFRVERNKNGRVHIKLESGTYLKATDDNKLRADHSGMPTWDDDDSATFKLKIVDNNLHGDYQLANGYGPRKAKEVLEKHRNSFITIEDFKFMRKHGVNTVRIPVGWWIAYDPEPPAPFVGGCLEILDNALSWAQEYDIKCIIDLHAAPGSQNGMEHSASRDGTTGWSTSPRLISQTLDVIDFLASRYSKHPALLGFELLNEPSAANVPADLLLSFYTRGYGIVRNYTENAYVIVCQRIGNADPLELYRANIGSHNLVIDLHYYNLFDSYFDNLSVADNIKFIHEARGSQIQALNALNGPLTYVGEWVNEWKVNGTKAEYQDFGRAQLEVYNSASFGWTYWTLKNSQKHWDFMWSVKNDYLQFGSACKIQVFRMFALLGSFIPHLTLHQIL